MNLKEQFEEVRDIPYNISVEYATPSIDCSYKHRQLYQWCINNGIPVRYRVCSFEWKYLPLSEELLTAAGNTLSLHVYLEVYYDKVWKNIDATWDKNLSHIFPVNFWDSNKAMDIAVPILSLYSLQKSQKIMTETETLASFEKDMKKNKSFYIMFNSWLEEERQICKK